MIPGERRSPGEEILTPVFLPGEFHGQRSLAGYGPWGHEASDTTEQARTHAPILGEEHKNKLSDCYLNNYPTKSPITLKNIHILKWVF